MKIKLVAGTVIVVVGAWAGATFYTGSQLKQRLPEMITNANTELAANKIPAVLSLENVQSGFLSTTADLVLKSNDQSLMTFTAKAAHGPLPNFSSFGLANVEANLTNADGFKKMFGLKTDNLTAQLSSVISFSGASKTQINMSPIKESTPLFEVETSPIKLSINFVDSTTFNTQLETDKLTIKQPSMLSADQFNELVTEKLSLTATQSASATKLPNANVKTSIAKLSITNVDNKQYSTNISDIKFDAALTSKDNAFSVSYVGSTGDMTVGNANVGKLSFDSSFDNLATDIFAQNGNAFAALAGSINMLGQNVSQMDEATLASKPSLTIKKYELANASGSANLTAQVNFQAPKADAQTMFDSLPVSVAKASLINDKAFVQTLIEQVLTVDGLPAEEAKKQALNNMEQAIGMGQMFNLIAVADEKIKFEISLENGKVMLNGKELTEQQIQQMMGMVGGGF